MKKALLKEYLQFSKKEQLGLLVLIILILVFAVFPFLHAEHRSKAVAGKPDTLLNKDMVILDNRQGRQPEAAPGDDAVPYGQQEPPVNADPVSAKHLFRFDPNTLDKEGWKELGLRDRTIQTIINYRNKGGRFRKPEDLQKMYGLHQDEFVRLRPYIAISSPQFSNQPAHFQKKDAPFYPPRRVLTSIDINAADTTAYIALPGIGSKLAARIVNFRNKLGGFYCIEQVGETYGVPPETFENIKQYLKLAPGSVRKLDLNTASYEALNAHPYISSKLAYLITKQRKTAPITAAGTLKELIAQTNDSFDKVIQYVSF